MSEPVLTYATDLETGKVYCIFGCLKMGVLQISKPIPCSVINEKPISGWKLNEYKGLPEYLRIL